MVPIVACAVAAFYAAVAVAGTQQPVQAHLTQQEHRKEPWPRQRQAHAIAYRALAAL